MIEREFNNALHVVCGARFEEVGEVFVKVFWLDREGYKYCLDIFSEMSSMGPRMAN